MADRLIILDLRRPAPIGLVGALSKALCRASSDLLAFYEELTLTWPSPVTFNRHQSSLSRRAPSGFETSHPHPLDHVRFVLSVHPDHELYFFCTKGGSSEVFSPRLSFHRTDRTLCVPRGFRACLSTFARFTERTRFSSSRHLTSLQGLTTTSRDVPRSFSIFWCFCPHLLISSPLNFFLVRSPFCLVGP
jgi:hypothetical protein